MRRSSLHSGDLKYCYDGEEYELGGYVGGDPTVGTEIVSGPEPGQTGGISTERARTWYRDSIDIASGEHGFAHEPCGRIDKGSSTAGLHLHLSPLSIEQAQDLYRLCEEPWFKVFVCSSITDDEDQPYLNVFRNAYVNFNGLERGHHGAVNFVNPDEGHWEWRLPEPMTEDHFDLLMEFLDRWRDNRTAGREWARDLVMDGDDRITAYQRLDAINFSFEDESEYVDVTVARVPSTLGSDSEQFFWTVYESAEYPFIYRAATDDGREYYVFESHTNSSTFELDEYGVTIDSDTIIDAESLAPASDPPVEAIQSRMEDPVPVEPDEPVRSEATSVLEEVVTS